MVSKIKKSKTNEIFSEKYILILLISGYLLGICIGCYFVFSNISNADFTNNVIKSGYIKSLIFFPCAFILKYSGVLSGFICTLTLFTGTQNALLYCNNILNTDNKIVYPLILTVLKDTAVIILLILYITIIINQIIHKKYNIKKDIKYFSVYFCGAIIINVSEFILKTFIF